MEITGAVNGILFIIITLVQTILALLVLSYAGYSFLTVFVNTSAGTDEVIWPKDPFQDWIWKSVYLAWLLAVWAIPAWLLANLLDVPLWLFGLIVLGFLWLMFPIGLLSSMSASSQWVILRPLILRMFVGNILSTLAFYVVSGLLLAGLGVLLYYTVLGPFYFVPVGALAGAAVILIYSRLLGRIGWVFTQQHVTEQLGDEDEDEQEDQRAITRRTASSSGRTPPPGAKRKPAGPARAKPNRGEQAGSADPWTASLEQALRKGTKPAPYVPSDPETPYGRPGGSYDVLPEDRSWGRVPSSGPQDSETASPPFSVASSSEKQGPKYPSFALPEPDEPSPEQERKGKVAIRHEVPPPPSWPLWSGVYTFPFYPTSLAAFSVLSIGFLGMIILFRTQVDFWPFGAGE